MADEEFVHDVRMAMLRGMDAVAEPFKKSLGPKTPETAEGNETEDLFEKIGAEMLRGAMRNSGEFGGNGRATACVIAHTVAHEAVQAVAKGSDPDELKRGIDKAVAEVIANISNKAKGVKTNEQIRQVGAISANGEEGIGFVIADAFEKVGRAGVIVVEDTQGADQEIIEGLQFDTGYLAPYFLKNADAESTSIESPYVLVHEDMLTDVRPFEPIFEAVKDSGKPLIIVADGFSGEALAALVIKRRQGHRISVIEMRGNAANRRALLEEIARITNGTAVGGKTHSSAFDPETLGKAERVILNKGGATVFEGMGAAKSVKGQIKIGAEFAEIQFSGVQDKQHGQGIAVIKVGGANPDNSRTRKAKVDGALLSTRAAIYGGFVAGGGVALLRASQAIQVKGDNVDQDIGIGIVRSALARPIRQIAINAGEKEDAVVDNVLRGKKASFGFDANSGVFVDMFDKGIVDPAHVVCAAVATGASIIDPIVRVENLLTDLEPGKPTFYFSLEGDQVAGNEAVLGSTFDLAFRHGVLPGTAAAAIAGLRLDPVAAGQSELYVQVAPRGLELLEGKVGRVVRFDKNGRMDFEPRFRLRAPQAIESEPGKLPYGVYVIFSIGGSVVYTHFIEIRIVKTLTRAFARPEIVNLDLSQSPPPPNSQRPRMGELVILKRGGPFNISGKIDEINIAPEETRNVTEASLQHEYETGGTFVDLKAIAEKSVWKSIDAGLGLPGELQEAASECVRRAAIAGSRLYQTLGEDHKLKEVLDRIDGLPDGSTITVLTEGIAFPWEILYSPLYTDASAEPPNCDRFFGARFIFETLFLVTDHTEKLPLDRRQPGELHVTMGINSQIDNEWKGRPLLPVRLQREYFDSQLTNRGRFIDRHEDVLKAIVKSADRASLIYFFCHGTANRLQFEIPDRYIEPLQLKNQPIYPRWPVIFVNACEAGDISPLSFVSFRKEFRNRKAAGLIAPSFLIPTLFAAVFAKAFLERYVDRQCVGDILFNLRRELLAKNNPLGLWYALQCPLDVVAPLT